MFHPATCHGLLATTAAMLSMHAIHANDIFAATAYWCASLFYLGLASRRRH